MTALEDIDETTTDGVLLWAKRVEVYRAQKTCLLQYPIVNGNHFTTESLPLSCGPSSLHEESYIGIIHGMHPVAI